MLRYGILQAKKTTKDYDHYRILIPIVSWFVFRWTRI
nr:unnamed protein product [Callosobruchus analis]